MSSHAFAKHFVGLLIKASQVAVHPVTVWHDSPLSADLVFQDTSSLGHDPDSVHFCARMAALNVRFVSFVQASILQSGPLQESGRRTPADGIGVVLIPELEVESPELEARSPLGRHARVITSLATSPFAARASLTGSRRWQGENVWEGSLAGDLAGWKTRVLRFGLWEESRLRIFWPPSGPMAALPLLIHRCDCDAPTAQPAPPGVVPSARTRACNSQLGSATNLPSVQ